MVQITGKYLHERNENLDEYFRAVGVPYIPRKMMAMSSPTLEITNDDEIWTISNITMLRTVVFKFKLGEEYEEVMPGTIIKSTTILEDDKLKTTSVAPGGTKVTRVYEFSDDGCVVTMTHEDSGIVAKRFYRRAK